MKAAARLWSVSLLATCLAGTAGCYDSHARPGGRRDDEGSLDAGTGAGRGARDGAARGEAGAPADAASVDAGPCFRPSPPNFGDGECTPERDDYCAEWADSVAAGRQGHSVCRLGGCTVGDFCTEEGCRCGPTRICPAGHVCVTEADGSLACPYACLP